MSSSKPTPIAASLRHCERSEAIQSGLAVLDCFVVTLLAITSYAAALTAPLVGTEATVFSTREAIWYGSPCEFGRRSSR